MLSTGLRALQMALAGLGIYLVSTAVSPLVGATPAPRAALPEVAAPLPATVGADRYAVISERNLFKTRGQPVAAKAKEEQLEETALKVRLLGTTVSKTPEYSVASVEDVAGRTTLALRIHDTVAGAELVRIERGRIVLDNGGVLESLSLADDAAAGGSASAAAKASQGRRSVRVARSAAGGVSRPPRGRAAAAGRASSSGRQAPSSRAARGSSAGSGASGGAASGTSGDPAAVQSTGSRGSNSDTAGSPQVVESDPDASSPDDRPPIAQVNQAQLHGVESALQTVVGTNGLDLQPGEVIVAMDGQNVSSPEGIESAVRGFVAAGSTTLTIVASDGSSRDHRLIIHIGGPAH